MVWVNSKFVTRILKKQATELSSFKIGSNSCQEGSIVAEEEEKEEEERTEELYNTEFDL